MLIRNLESRPGMQARFYSNCVNLMSLIFLLTAEIYARYADPLCVSIPPGSLCIKAETVGF